MTRDLFAVRAALVRLYRIHEKRVRIAAQLAAAREAAAKAREALDAARAARDDRAKALQEAGLAVREADRRLAEVEERIRRLRAREGEIRDAKAAAAWQEEMDALSAERAAAEEAGLAALAAEEERRRERDAAEGRAAEAEEAFRRAEADAEAVAREVEPILSDLAARDAELRESLPPEPRAVVRALHDAGRGDIIAAIEGAACSACGAAIPPDTARRAAAGDLARCPGCGRYLFESLEDAKWST